MKKSALLPYACLVLLAACSKSNSNTAVTTPTNPDTTVTTIPTDTTPSTTYNITLLASSTLFAYTPTVTPMKRQDYNELSGVAASRLNAGILYMHDDNANSPIIITNANGDDLGTIVLDNVTTVNPEDISVATGPVDGKTYIYYADIGDNSENRSSVTIYRFEEPEITNPGTGTVIHITSVDKISLKYPSGAVNAETLLVDPLTNDIFIPSKETSKSTLYRAAYPQSVTATTTMTSVLKMPFDLLTGGDISGSGNEILLRDKGEIWYWQRTAGQTIVQTLQTAPQKAPYTGNEHQGEGVGFAADSSGYYTNTEIKGYTGAVSNISFYKRN